MTSMFWGLRLEPGKRYSTTVDKSFHVSMAALDCTTVKSEKEVFSVMLEEGESNIPFILCNLQKPKVIQSVLNLNFVSGDRVTFFCRGNGTVHLTGYLISEDDDDDFAAFGEEDEEVEEEEEDEEEDDDEGGVEEEQESDTPKGKVKQNGLPGAKRKVEQPTKANKKKKQKIESPDTADSDVSEEDDEDEEMEDESIDEEAESEEDSDENEMDEDISETEEKKPQPPQQQQQKKKKNKKQKNQQQQPQNVAQQQGKQKQQPNGMTQQSPGQQKKKQGNEEKVSETTVPAKKTLEGGIVVKDLKMGNGPVCKPGRMVSVYYVGRLKSNNKVFDQTTQGPGFKFRVGRGEVIKGWDIGLSGMKVGGKRLITCPPNMAYGQKGSPPTIPGNSTLMFEVELKAVN